MLQHPFQVNIIDFSNLFEKTVTKNQLIFAVVNIAFF